MFKQLFCKHIYKHIDQKYLRTEEKIDQDTMDHKKYDVLKDKLECDICGKVKIKETYKELR